MRRGLSVLAAVAVLSGCSSGSFVGRRLDNFTAYYNALYNARDGYDTAVRTLRRETAVVDRTRYLAVFPVPSAGGQQAKFESTVKKAADVLREHPGSKWTDDALLLIGQSYFHLGQHVAAEQKFREVVNEWRGAGGKPSPLRNEARLWLARALVAGARDQAATQFLTETLAREGLSRGLGGRLQLIRADLAVTQGRWDEAAEALRAGLEAVRDRDLRARAYFLLGQVEETRGQMAASAEAFRAAVRQRPDYDLAYAAAVSAARVGGTEAGADAGASVADGSLRALRRLADDDKNADRRAELAYLRGRVFQSSRRPDDALGAYRDALYGGHRDASAVRGRAQYALGTLYRDGYGDYFRAAVHFDSAATDLGGRGAVAAVRVPLTREAILDAAEQKATFASYAGVRRSLAETDSLLYLGGLDDEAFAAAVLAIRQQRGREQAAQDRELARRNENRAFGGTVAELGRSPETPSATSAATPAAANAGFLFFQDPVRVRENRQAFIERWGDRPLVPNWRRREAISGQGAVALAASEERRPGTLGRPGDAGDALPQIDLSPIPRSPEALGAMRARRAEQLYTLGGVFFLSMGQPDSAAAVYRGVIEEAPDAPVAPRAYYALAEVQRSLGDTLAAGRLYRETLARYADLDFSARIRERLGMAPAPVVRTDSLARAEAAYRAASEAAAARAPDAFARLISVAAEYRGTPVAAQALLAAGRAFLEAAGGDSLAVRTDSLPADTALLARAGIHAAAAPAAPRADTAAALASSPPLPPNKRLAADTSAVAQAPDSSAALAGALVVAAAPVAVVPQAAAAPRLADLYRGLAALYPGSPYATQAQGVLAALDPAAAANAGAVPGATTPAGRTPTPPVRTILKGRTVEQVPAP